MGSAARRSARSISDCRSSPSPSTGPRILPDGHGSGTICHDRAEVPSVVTTSPPRAHTLQASSRGKIAITVSETAPAEAPPIPDHASAAVLAPIGTVGSQRRAGWIVTISLLGVAFLTALTLLGLSILQLEAAQSRIDRDRELLDQQIDRIGELEQLVEKKETFAAAMRDLATTASGFDGALYGDLVPESSFESIAMRGWGSRWDADAMDDVTAEARFAAEELSGVLAAARTEASGNRSGTTYEAVLDRLGNGFVTASIDDADVLCEQDVLACVMSDDPYTVHFDTKNESLPYMTDWLRTGLAYHEFAHVLQLTNPEPTQQAATAFAGDEEVMADCFALTFLDGWTLDHRVWTSDGAYWDVSMGYGHICDDGQRQAVRDWYGQLGYESGPITQ